MDPRTPQTAPPTPKGRSTRTLAQLTSPQLKELRELNVLVMHPDDADGNLLTQQLQRIGCRVQRYWPPLPQLPANTDVVLIAVQPDSLPLRPTWVEGETAPTLIAVVNYENPTIVSAVLALDVQAVLPSPVRSFGLLSTLVVARHTHKMQRQQQQRLLKVQRQLHGLRRVAQAKTILMQTHRLSESQAYEHLREQAMNRRCAIEEVAEAIVHASELLSLGKKD